jgi:hypothetical protein
MAGAWWRSCGRFNGNGAVDQEAHCWDVGHGGDIGRIEGMREGIGSAEKNRCFLTYEASIRFFTYQVEAGQLMDLGFFLINRWFFIRSKVF